LHAPFVAARPILKWRFRRADDSDQTIRSIRPYTEENLKRSVGSVPHDQHQVAGNAKNRPQVTASAAPAQRPVTLAAPPRATRGSADLLPAASRY